MDQLINQSLDRYKIVTLLGEGGMGAVFKARDLTLQRDVAVKIMHPHFARQPNFQERFLQEARTAARLSHPSIVPVYDFGQHRGLLYIVMKFINGDNLEKMLERLKPQGKWVTLNEGLAVTRSISLALDYAHRQGILHRDIKPANIMIEPDNTHESGGALPYRPILTDLGLAKLAEGGMVTQDGTSMGTPAYMSPEQALGQKSDPRSDVYSLGVLLFELSTGQRPFPARSLTEAIEYHTRQAPPRPRSIRPELPAELESIILKTLEKDPAARYQTAAELAKALEDCLAAGLPDAKPADEQADATPTAFAGAVSLITQYQESLQPRGNSIFEGAPRPATAGGQDRIQVVLPNRSSRLLPINKQSVVIGRDPSADLPIDDTKISRHHARIEFDGNAYHVIDLDSTNGTFLANARLLPGIAEVWTPEKALRIGDTYLRLIRAQAASSAAGAHPGLIGGTGVIRADGTQIDPNQVSYSPGDGRIGLVIESAVSDNLPVLEPGRATNLPITLLNQGPVVDHFKLSVEGLPAAWLPATLPAAQLMPGAQQQVTLIIQPPRTSQSRAGRYPATVRVASQDNPNQFAETRLTLTVAPFSQFTTELFPQRVKAGRPARLTIKNNGNIQENYNLTWFDRADELQFQPPVLQLRVSEGQTAVAEFRAQPKQRRLIGAQQTHGFTTRVAPAQGEPQQQTGELLSNALISTWVLPVLATLCLLLVVAAGLIFTNLQGQARQTTATALAAETQVAGIVAGTAGARTAEALSLVNANLATQQAATQLALVESTTGAANTQSAAIVLTATQAAADSQNGQTATALAVAQQTALAQQTAAAQTAEAGAQLTANAMASANAQTAIAGQTLTAQAVLAAEMDFFTDNWVNVDSLTGGMRRLIIERESDTSVTFHGYGKCSPSDCDWGPITVPFTPPATEGTYDFGFVKTKITIERAADDRRLDITVFNDYAPGDARADTTNFYTFETLADRNQAMNEFIGWWYNNDPSNFPQLEVTRKDDFTLAFQGFGACSPSFCDWGLAEVPFTPPSMTGRWTFSFKTTTITTTRSDANLNVRTFDEYNPGDSRPNRTVESVFHR